MIDWIKTAQGGGGDRGRNLRDHGLVERLNLGLPRLVFSPEAPIHAWIEALQRLNRDTRLGARPGLVARQSVRDFLARN
jgi:hypothetical protein